MKRSLVFLFLWAGAVFAQSESVLQGHAWRNSIVFDKIDLTGAASDTSAWIYIGDYQYFTLYDSIYTDSSNFDLALDDSLGFDIDYELYHGYRRPTASTGGDRPKSTLTQTEVKSFTIADTAWVATYQSLHTLSSVAVSPSTWIRFYINKDAKHVLTRHLRLLCILWRQP